MNKEQYDKIFNKIKANWDHVAKPIDGMGKFETITAKIGAVLEQEHPSLSKCGLVVFLSDNGIVEEGVSQCGQEVTAACVRSIVNGKTSVSAMANAVGVRVFPVDVGVNDDLELNEQEEAVLIRKKIRKGTRNFYIEKAMTKVEMNQAIDVGINFAKQLKEEGYELVAAGEIGIGNTTTSSAMAAALLGIDASEVTGFGAGLSKEGYQRKLKVIKESLAKYCLIADETEEILMTFGGYDIAAMTGFYLGAYKYGLPVVLDGVISLVAALTAYRMNKEVANVLIPSHNSREVAAIKIAKELGLEPMIYANMALGEGTGAVLMIQLIKTAYAVYQNSGSFESIQVDAYERFEN